jgi:hydroxymethylbilane synthase
MNVSGGAEAAQTVVAGAPPRHLRLGTRGSALARWQSEWVAARLAELGISVELVLITTQGDASSLPLGEIGGQGVFTKEIQRALLGQRIDLAVHSLKDLPTEPVAGLTLAAVPARESNHDVLVCREASGLETLAPGARVGTGSLRRQAQLLHHRPDLQIETIRGNVDTRLRRLDDGQYDAIVLAEAGLRRLQLQDRITQILPHSVMLPAVGQGALGIEIRAGEAPIRAALEPLDHGPTHGAVLAERAMLAALRAGCLAPVGAWGRLEDDRLRLDGVVLSPDGRSRLTVSVAGSPEAPGELGAEAARQLISQGADRLIAGSRGRNSSS